MSLCMMPAPHLIELNAAACLCRCRHAVAAVGPYVFTFGGLRGSTLLDDFLLADDSSGSELSICDPRAPAWYVYGRNSSDPAS